MTHADRRTDEPEPETPRPRRADTRADTDRGISDLIGFVLAFLVIIASVALVSTFGVDALQGLKSDQQENNAAQAFAVMAENFDEIERGLAPSRTAEIDLHTGQMMVKNDTEFTVDINHRGTGDFVRHFFPKRIVLQPNTDEPTVIAYQNGATIRGDRGTSQGIIENRPRFICEDDQAILSMVTLRTDENRQLGDGTVRITGREEDTDLIYPVNRTGQNSTTNVTVNLNVSIQGGLQRAWISNLVRSEQDWQRVPHENNEVFCPSPERVYLRETVINVTFVR